MTRIFKSTDYATDSWILAQLKPNCQNIASRNIHQQGFTHFIPLCVETRRTRTGFSTVKRPLFPGYAFVNLAGVPSGWRAISATRGVSRIVSFGGSPTYVNPTLIEALRSRCDESDVFRPPEELAAGDEVRVTSGPFASFVAKIAKIDSDKRVWVLLDVMGRETRVAIPREGLALA